MKMKEITMSASRTINLGNYESMTVKGGCTIELTDVEGVRVGQDSWGDQDVVHNVAIKEIKTQMEKMFIALKPKTK